MRSRAAFVDEHGTEKRFFHPENLAVQWGSEWGLPHRLGAADLDRLVDRSRVPAEARLCPPRCPVWAGGHGCARARRLFARSCRCGGRRSRHPRGGGGFGSRSNPHSVAPALLRRVVALLLLGAGLALSMHQQDVFTLDRQIRAALEAEDHDGVRQRVQTGLALHPSEPIFALAGAEVAVREGDETAPRWINRAQDVAPLWNAPHLLAARWLFSIGRMDQGLIEIREAEALFPGSARMTICTILRAHQDPAIALRAAPRGPDGARFLDRAASCLPLQSPVAIEIDEAARKIDPDLVRPATRRARRLLAADRPLEAVDVLRDLPVLDTTARRVLAEAYMEADDPRSAAHAISPILNRREVSRNVLRTASSIYMALGDDSEIQRLASELRRQTGGKAEPLADVELFLGGLYESHGRYALALKAYEDSNQALESRRALQATARVAEAMGKPGKGTSDVSPPLPLGTVKKAPRAPRLTSWPTRPRTGPSTAALDATAAIRNAGVRGKVRHLTTERNPAGGAAEHGSFVPKAFRGAILRYRWWIVLTTLAVTAVVALFTLRMPKVYQATTTLEYDPNPTTPLGSTVEDVGVSHFLMSKEFFETQNLIIQSRAVAERVVARMGLDADPSFFRQEDSPDWDTGLEDLGRGSPCKGGLSVDPIKNTRLVRLEIRDYEPERAAALANMVADAYIEKTMEDRLGSTAAAAEWLAQQLDSTRKQLNESEHALHEFKKQHNVLSVSLENRQSLLSEEIREYNERLTEVRARRIELQARLERLRRTRANPRGLSGQRARRG